MKLYDENCRKCKKPIKNCICIPVPCPFCKEEFGFTQDWNIHIEDSHKKEMIIYDR